MGAKPAMMIAAGKITLFRAFDAIYLKFRRLKITTVIVIRIMS